MNRNELAQKIGLFILNETDKIQKQKKDFGQHLVVPFKLPLLYGEPDFIWSISFQMPRFSYVKIDGSYESFTMSEYYGWSKND